MSNDLTDKPLTGNGWRAFGRKPAAGEMVFQREKAPGMTAALMRIAGRRLAAQQRPGRHRA